MEDIKFETRDAWLEWRKKGIGASDAPIILGLSKYKTPGQLFKEKVGHGEQKPLSNFAVRRGIELEPIARRKFANRYNFVHDVEETFAPANVVHPEHEFMRASLDGRSFDGNLIVEIKFQGVEWHHRAIYHQEIRPDYFAQIQHQLLVSGAKKAVLVSINQDHHIAVVPIERDEATMLHILDVCTQFWRHILDFEVIGD